MLVQLHLEAVLPALDELMSDATNRADAGYILQLHLGKKKSTDLNIFLSHNIIIFL